jgi:hypothetical protein
MFSFSEVCAGGGGGLFKAPARKRKRKPKTGKKQVREGGGGGGGGDPGGVGVSSLQFVVRSSSLSSERGAGAVDMSPPSMPRNLMRASISASFAIRPSPIITDSFVSQRACFVRFTNQRVRPAPIKWMGFFASVL